MTVDHSLTIPSDWRWHFEPDCMVAEDRAWWSRWDQLNASGCHRHPLLDSRFVTTAVRHLGATHLMRVVGRDSKGDAAMALLRRESPWSSSIYQPSQAPVPFVVFRQDVVTANAAPSALLAGGSRLLPMVLKVPQVDPDRLPVEALLKKGHIDRGAIGTTIAVQAPDFETYWRSRPASLQRSIRRNFRRLQAEGLSWRLERVTRPTEIREVVADYGRLESAGWKRSAGTAVHPDNHQGRFYAELLDRFAATGQGLVYRFWIDEQVAAMRLVVEGGGMAVILKTTFNEALARFGPGRLCLHLMLEDLLTQPGVERVEFYTHANADTLQWGTESRELYAVINYRWTVAKRAVDAAKGLRRYSRRLLGQATE